MPGVVPAPPGLVVILKNGPDATTPFSIERVHAFTICDDGSDEMLLPVIIINECLAKVECEFEIFDERDVDDAILEKHLPRFSAENASSLWVRWESKRNSRGLS